MRIEYNPSGAFQSFYANRQQCEENLKSSNNNANEKKKAKSKIATAALIGAIAPVVALNVAKGRGKNLKAVFKNPASTLKNKFKAVYDMFEIENYSDMLASTTGAILGGTMTGASLDKDPENKEAKYKEGIFEFLNNMTPTTFVAAGEFYSRKTGKFTSAPARAALIASSVVGGMFIANKASNKINEKVFDKKEDKKEKRGFKISDCFVHLDDILGLLVLAKIPLAKVIQADKFLPLLYARCGYEAGCAHKHNKDNRPKKKEGALKIEM